MKYIFEPRKTIYTMTMKKVFLIAISLMFATLSVVAQEEPAKEEENLFNNITLSSVTGFGGITNQFTSIENEFDTFTGVVGGVLFNQTIYIGAYGVGLSSVHKMDNHVDSLKDNLEFPHGGLMVGYNHNPYKLVHWTFCSKIGWGSLGLYEGDDYEDLMAIDKVLVMIPTIGVEMNITKWFKLNGDVGYRVVSGVDKIEFYKEKDLNKPTASLTLLFGGFKNK